MLRGLCGALRDIAGDWHVFRGCLFGAFWNFTGDWHVLRGCFAERCGKTRLRFVDTMGKCCNGSCSSTDNNDIENDSDKNDHTNDDDDDDKNDDMARRRGSAVMKKIAFLSICAFCAPRGRYAPLATPRRASRPHPAWTNGANKGS